MKIFCISDLHGKFNHLQKIIDFVNSRPDIDVVIFAGDITKDYRGANIFELQSLQMEDYEYFKLMIKEIKNKVVYFIRGNHDVFEPYIDDINFLPNVYNTGIETRFVPLEKMCIKFLSTSREITELEMEIYLKNIDMTGKYVVAHQPPLKILDLGYSAHNYGSDAIRKKIEKDRPAYYICGHVHEDFGVKKLNGTVVINCACMENIVRGTIIDTNCNLCKEVLL